MITRLRVNESKEGEREKCVYKKKKCLKTAKRKSDWERLRERERERERERKRAWERKKEREKKNKEENGKEGRNERL